MASVNSGPGGSIAFRSSENKNRTNGKVKRRRTFSNEHRAANRKGAKGKECLLFLKISNPHLLLDLGRTVRGGAEDGRGVVRLRGQQRARLPLQLAQQGPRGRSIQGRACVAPRVEAQLREIASTEDLVNKRIPKSVNLCGGAKMKIFRSLYAHVDIKPLMTGQIDEQTCAQR